MYEKEFQADTIGIATEHEIYPIRRTASTNSFVIDRYALLILQGNIMGLMFVVDREYYDVLDTYSRNTVCMLSSNGTVFVVTSTEVVLLDEYICSLSEEPTGRCLEILPVGFI